MTNVDQLGLLGYANWLTGHGFLLTIFLCWLLTPGMMIVIAPLLESRWLPLGRYRQFRSFFPGDLFLGVSTAGLLVLAQTLPPVPRWYNSGVWHWSVQIAAIAVALVLTWSEYKAGAYPLRAILSPTKLYHNFLLYGGYGYVALTTLVAVLFGSDWTWSFAGWLVLCLLPLLWWGYLVIQDNSLSGEQARWKAASAHIEDWTPIWWGWHRLVQR